MEEYIEFRTRLKPSMDEVSDDNVFVSPLHWSHFYFQGSVLSRNLLDFVPNYYRYIFPKSQVN